MSSFIEKNLTELPEHIINSAFYKRLNDVNPVTLTDALIFPSDLYKETFEIETTTDLCEAIASDSYFGYDEATKIQILENIHKFWLKTEDPIILPHMDLTHFSRQVHELLKNPEDKIIMVCMKLNCAELLKFALKKNFNYDRGAFFGSYSNLYYAASNNSIECVRIGLENGFEINTVAFETAVEKDRKEIVKMFVEAGFRKSSRMCKLSKNLEMLEYLNANGFPWDNETTDIFAKKGNYECLEWAIARGCPISEKICVNAAAGGNVRCLELAFAHSAYRSENISMNAIYHDRLETFVYAAEHGVKVTHYSMDQLRERNSFTNEVRQINITPGKVSKYINK